MLYHERLLALATSSALCKIVTYFGFAEGSVIDYDGVAFVFKSNSGKTFIAYREDILHLEE